jgi:ACDE family multidrug resistance protein
MKQNMWFPFAVLCGVPFVMVLSNSMLIPVLPLMQTAMNLSPFQMGLIITAFSIPAGLTIPIAGYLSDRIGRRIIMGPALLLFGLGGLLAGLVSLWVDSPFMLILIARVLQGIGGGGTYQIAIALTGDIFQTAERAKALGMLESANGLGKVISPVLGAALGMVAWFAPFFVYPVMAWPIAAGVLWVVKEPKLDGKPKPFKKYARSVASTFKKQAGSILAAFLAGFLVLFMLFGVLSYWSDVLDEENNIQGIMRGLLIAVPVLVLAITSYGTGVFLQKNVERYGKIVLAAGVFFLALALPLPALTHGMWLMMLAISIQGLGSGLVLPAVNTLITGSAPREERGIITAFYGTVRFFGAALGPPIFGLLADSRIILFLGSAAVSFAAGIVAYLFIKVPQPEEDSKKKKKEKEKRRKEK